MRVHLHKEKKSNTSCLHSVRRLPRRGFTVGVPGFDGDQVLAISSLTNLLDRKLIPERRGSISQEWSSAIVRPLAVLANASLAASIVEPKTLANCSSNSQQTSTKADSNDEGETKTAVHIHSQT